MLFIIKKKSNLFFLINIMPLNIFSFKLIIIVLLVLKASCIQKNISLKNSTIRLNYTSYFINSTIRTISDKNFDTVISYYKDSYDYLILFTLRRCSNCNQVVRLVENVEKIYSNKNKKLKFYKVDSYLSSWTSLRFDVYKSPKYIYITKNVYASFEPKELTEEELVNFIENNNKEFLIYPKKIGFFGLMNKIVNNITKSIKINIPFWNDYLTWLFLCFIFIGFFYFEYKLYQVTCCKNKDNKNDINEKKHKNKKNNEDKIKKNKINKDEEKKKENINKTNKHKDFEKSYNSKLKDE